MTMSDSIQDIGFIVQKMYTMVVNFYMIVTYFKMDFLFCNEHMDGESIISVFCHSIIHIWGRLVCCVLRPNDSEVI